LPTLLHLRSERDLSQMETAKMIGISIGSYSNAENGKPVSKKTAQLIGKAFDIDPKQIDELNIAPRRIKRPVKSELVV